MPSQPGNWAGHHAPRNHLLEVLSPSDWASVEPLLERMDLAVSDSIERQGEVSPWLHFPESAIISVVHSLADGRRVEVGTVGNEGMCGLSAWHEAEADESFSVCSVAGATLRGRASEMISLAAHRPAIRRLLNRYAGAYIVLVAQDTACNRRHVLEQRCARWLLMTQDRLPDLHPVLTRDLLAVMLGTASATVMLAIREMSGRGLIRVEGHRVEIIHRAGLERASCECYAVVRAHFAKLS